MEKSKTCESRQNKIDERQIRSKRCSQSNKILFTGGGTGGHVYPNLALAQEFKKRGYAPIYMGGKNSVEQKLAEQENIPFFDVPTVKLVRSFGFGAIKNNLSIPRTLHTAVKKAMGIIKAEKPCCIISKGGFASLPAVLGASKLGIPIFAHESDKTLGLANKIAKTKGATILKANPKASFDGEFVGMPLRRALFCADRSSALNKLGINTDKKIVLILGGSSGAQVLNDCVYKNLDKLCNDFFVLHILGKGKGKSVKHKNYMSFEYADNIADFYAVCDIVVSRAGATAVFEISALKKRALFIPLPKGVSRGDQIDNAYLAEEYGASVLLQNEAFFDNFINAVSNTLKKPPMRNISADANGKIADIVCDRLRRGEICKDKKQSQNGSPSLYS